MTIFTNYAIGDIVYLVCDTNATPRIILEILIKPSGIEYCLGNGLDNNWNYEIEFSKKTKTKNA
ncbi:MAG: hypothetical protein JJE55_08095 [Flavobacteriaceae bacterium]|nr:hypothetical protein [Flavobacteriaceae bacterium]